MKFQACLTQSVTDASCRVEGGVLYGQCRCFFTIERAVAKSSAPGKASLLAFVRWYEPLEEDLQGTSFRCLRWDQGSDYDVVHADSLLRPIALQPHPDEDYQGQFVLNHHVRGL